jgi:hypothetical protein
LPDLFSSFGGYTGVRCKENTPLLFFVCLEARSVVINRYSHTLRGNQPRSPIVYVDTERDVVSFSESSFGNLRSLPEELSAHRDLNKHLRVAISLDLLFLKEQIVWGIIKAFPNMKELCLSVTSSLEGISGSLLL